MNSTKKTPQGSKRGELNNIDWLKIGKGAIIALAGALATYLATLSGTIDFGDYTPLVTALFSVVVNLLNRWISDNSN